MWSTRPNAAKPCRTALYHDAADEFDGGRILAHKLPFNNIDTFNWTYVPERRLWCKILHHKEPAKGMFKLRTIFDLT